eukprot:9231462-Heterocapsa_arctica.AAC.1
MRKLRAACITVEGSLDPWEGGSAGSPIRAVSSASLSSSAQGAIGSLFFFESSAGGDGEGERGDSSRSDGGLVKTSGGISLLGATS